MKQLPRKHVRARRKAEEKYPDITYAEMCANIVPAKRKRRWLTKLSIKEIKEIQKAVKVDYLTFESAAIKYNTNVSTVGNIVRAFKHTPDYEGELLAKQAKKEERLAAAVSTIEGFIARNEDIWTLKQVADAAAAKHGVKLGHHAISDVLKSHFDMRFHKVKRVPFKGNSERSLVVRQQCAKKLLELLEQGCRVINIDESWINEVDF